MPGLSQRKDASPGDTVCYQKEYKLKYVKSVSCVTQFSCVKPVRKVKNAALNLPVRARLQNIWVTWLDLGAGSKVVQILRKGYTLPFWIWPNLTRSPNIINCYVNPHRNHYLLEALQVAPAQNKPFRHEVQQVASVCVTSTGSPGLSSGRTQPIMGGSGRICLPTSSHLGQSGGEVAGLAMQENHSDCSGVVQHALVLGSSGHVQPNPTEPAQSAQPIDTALQSDPSQKSDKAESPCMAPKASAIKEQGFSEAVAARI